MRSPTLERDNLERDGFEMQPRFLTAQEQQCLLDFLGPITGAGRRALLSTLEINAFARSTKILELLRSHLPGEPFPVRAIYFDKSSQTGPFLGIRILPSPSANASKPQASKVGASKKASSMFNHPWNCCKRCSRYAFTWTQRTKPTVHCKSCPDHINSAASPHKASRSCTGPLPSSARLNQVTPSSCAPSCSTLPAATKATPSTAASSTSNTPPSPCRTTSSGASRPESQ